MFTVGDALLVGVVLWFVAWVLKRRWPEIFAGELARHLRLNNDQRESKATQDWILVVLKNELDRRGLMGGGVHGAKDASAPHTVPPRFATGGLAKSADVVREVILSGETIREKPSAEVAGFSNRADSNVGRAHVAEDGAFAGGLHKERPVEDQAG